ncbi:MAG: hypothetical protein IH983_02985, partial [Planctomycetes bacterium]|nr:hypothetical protein [Planctomycetota bacterium]
MWLRLVLPLTALAAALLLSVAPSAAQETTDEQKAAAELRRFATNIQFNRGDGSVRLVRLSKPSVTDEMLEKLKLFSKIDYLAVVCPQVTDAGLANIAGLTNLDTLVLSGGPLTDDRWHHVVWTRTVEGLNRLFIDGKQAAEVK